MEKQISVILVNYNGKKYNDACIASILNSTIAKRIQIVVAECIHGRFASGTAR